MRWLVAARRRHNPQARTPAPLGIHGGKSANSICNQWVARFPGTPAYDGGNALEWKNHARAGALATPSGGTRPTGPSAETGPLNLGVRFSLPLGWGIMAGWAWVQASRRDAEVILALIPWAEATRLPS